MTTPLHMSCYNDFKAWVRKRRRALLVTAGVVGVGIGTYYVAKNYYAALEEEKKRRQRLEADERAEAQLQSHFESVQRISDLTTLPSVLPHLKSRLFEAVDLSSLTEKLMAGKQSQQALTGMEKMQIWQDLKVLSFTRTFCAMWGVSLLSLFVRTQLNILGRRVYIDTTQTSTGQGMPNQNKLGHKPLTKGTQHKFIAFADYLPHRGLDALIADCHQVVRGVVQNKPLKELYTLEQLRDLLNSIREAFDRKGSLWQAYVLPEDNILPEDLAAASSAADAAQSHTEDVTSEEEEEMLNHLMDETRAVLTSEEFHYVLSTALDVVTDGVLEELRSTFGGIAERGIHLAKLLPPIASVGSSLLDLPQDNPYIQTLANLPQVKSFCANVYADAIISHERLSPGLIPC